MENDLPTTVLATSEGDSTPNTPVPATESEPLEGRSDADKLKREAQRLRSERNKAREEAEAFKKALEEINQTKEKAMNEETQKLIEQLNTEKSQLAKEVSRMKDLQALSGKVRDAEAALKLLDAEHRSEDGNINVDKLLEKYGFLSPIDSTPSVPGGGGVSGNKDAMTLEQAVAAKDNKAIVAIMDAMLGDRK